LKRAANPHSPASSNAAPTWGFALALVVVAAAAWSNSFGGPFVFDDLHSIVSNEQLRGPDAWWRVFTPAGRSDFGLAGRPIGAWTFALNYSLGGLSVAGYHAFNLAIHVAAGLVLFGLVRRTLALEPLRERWAAHADLLGALTAALFLLHPIQTKAVTFIVQRLESLTALLYLVTLYALVRGAADAARVRRWSALAVGACALGMGVKEVMVSAPLAALLYDRAFLSGSLRGAWRARRGLHLALASTWALLALFVLTSPRLGVTAATDLKLGRVDYLLLQMGAFGHYLRQIAWPNALVFDYGMFGDGVRPADFSALWWASALAVSAAVGAAVWGLARNRGWGFVAAAALGLFAPSSSIVPIWLDPLAEHRVYLPLAALALAAAFALFAFARRVAPQRARALTLGLGAVLALTLGAATHARNRDYASARALWGDTAAKRPTSARALTNLGIALVEAGELERALELQRAAVNARPEYAEAHHNLGNACLLSGLPEAALESFARALELDPDNAESCAGAGEALLRVGRKDEAAERFEQALAREPRLYGAHFRLAGIRIEQRRIDNAVQHLQAALALDGRDPQLWTLLGSLLAEQGRFGEARAKFERALRIQPGFADARAKLERLRQLDAR